MPRLTALDEYFVHQIPEPLPNVVTHHQHWRESLFFVMHPPRPPRRRRHPDDGPLPGTRRARHPPARHGRRHADDGSPRPGGRRRPAHVLRRPGADRDRRAVPPGAGCRSSDGIDVPVALDLTFTARTAAYGLRRGTMRAGHELIWDQSHMLQSGTYRGTYTHDGRIHRVEDWWGQRDHSWGIRDHARCPFWMWLAIQLPDGMLGGVALGADQRRPDLHRRLLRPCRRRRRRSPSSTSSTSCSGSTATAAPSATPATVSRSPASPGTSTSRWRAGGRSVSTPPAGGRSATATSAAGSTRSRSSPTTAAGARASTS